MKTDSVVSAGLGQSEPRVQHHQQRASRIVTTFRFHFALTFARLTSRPSVLIWSLVLVVGEPKVCFNIIEKKIQNRVGASMQPCFTQFLISNESETLPLYCMVVLMFV